MNISSRKWNYSSTSEKYSTWANVLGYFPILDPGFSSQILYLSVATCLSLLLSLSLFLFPPLLQAAWRTAESRLRFISYFLNVFLPVPLPARQPVCPPVCPPACLDIGFALWLWPYTRRATGASATAGPSVLSCRVVSSCHRGPILPNPPPPHQNPQHMLHLPTPPPCALIGFPSSPRTLIRASVKRMNNQS